MQNLGAPPSPFPEPNGGMALPDWSVLKVFGPDARTFLHGQLTQDVLTLTPNQARWAAYCTAQGRMLATFLMWAGSEQEVYLACSTDLAERVLKRLRMFVLRAQCQLQLEAGHVVGLVGRCCAARAGEQAPPMAVTPATGATQIELPPALGIRRALLWGPDPWQADAPEVPRRVWDALEVHGGMARLTAANVEQFVPQMVNLELIGGVNFQKGCYPGQEVVARSQYRGTLKRRAVLLAGAAPLTPGDELFVQDDPEQPAGRVVLAAPGLHPGDDHVALVEVRLSTLSQVLHAKSPDGPAMHRLELPYAIPELP